MSRKSRSFIKDLAGTFLLEFYKLSHQFLARFASKGLCFKVHCQLNILFETFSMTAMFLG
jgi:hypothetical protein